MLWQETLTCFDWRWALPPGLELHSWTVPCSGLDRGWESQPSSEARRARAKSWTLPHCEASLPGRSCFSLPLAGCCCPRPSSLSETVLQTRQTQTWVTGGTYSLIQFISEAFFWAGTDSRKTKDKREQNENINEKMTSFDIIFIHTLPKSFCFIVIIVDSTSSVSTDLLLRLWLTLCVLESVSDHLPDPPLLLPLFLLFSRSLALLVEGAVLLGGLPRGEPVQRGDTGHVVVLPCTVLLIAWGVGKEPAPSDAPACPQTILEREGGRRALL